MLLDLLMMIQEQSRGDPRTTLVEWRARADSEAVLRAIEMNWRWRVEILAVDAYYNQDYDDGDEAGSDMESVMQNDPAYGGGDAETGQEEFFDAVQFSGQTSVLHVCDDRAMEGRVTACRGRRAGLVLVRPTDVVPRCGCLTLWSRYL
jgi:hypothetical protein